MNDPTLADVQHIAEGPAVEALGLPHRVRIPPGSGPHPTLIMVHGLDGNEHVTWIFGRVVGPEWLIITPRAPFPSAGGFSWYAATQESFMAGLATLEKFIDAAMRYYPSDPAQLALLGFSQGTIMNFAYALRAPRPRPIAGIAALSGFIARLNEIEIPAQNGLPVLMLHGIRDERVPVKWAQSARDRLRQAGASVTYEESDTGHKVSASGMRLLSHWLASLLPAQTDLQG